MAFYLVLWEILHQSCQKNDVIIVNCVQSQHYVVIIQARLRMMNRREGAELKGHQEEM